jgi:predicted Zn-dependent protease
MLQHLSSRIDNSRRRRTLRGVALATLCIALALGLGGCKGGTNLTGPMSTDDERRLGSNIAAEIEKQYKFVEDPDIVRRVVEIAEPVFLQASKERGDVTYSIRIIDDPEVNAFSIPGGHVYIYKGLLDKLGTDDDALACVIGHETAHVVRRHVVKLIAQEQSSGLLVDIAAIASRSYAVGEVGSVVTDLQSLHYSRDDEYEADRYGLRFAYNAGYDPAGMLRTFHILEVVAKGSGAEAPYAEDHPITRNRALRVEEQLRELRANHGEYVSAAYDPNGDRIAAEKNGIDYNQLVLATTPPSLLAEIDNPPAGASKDGAPRSH